MVFGLSMNIGQDLGVEAGAGGGPGPYPYPWDPSNARQLLKWTIDHQSAPPSHQESPAAQQATNFAILHNLTMELWPDASRRECSNGLSPRCCLTQSVAGDRAPALRP